MCGVHMWLSLPVCCQQVGVQSLQPDSLAPLLWLLLQVARPACYQVQCLTAFSGLQVQKWFLDGGVLPPLLALLQDTHPKCRCDLSCGTVAVHHHINIRTALNRSQSAAH